MIPFPTMRAGAKQDAVSDRPNQRLVRCLQPPPGLLQAGCDL